MKRVFTEALSYAPKSLYPFHLAQAAKLPSYTPHSISSLRDVVSIKGNTSEVAPLFYTSGGGFSSSAGSFFRATNHLLQKSPSFYTACEQVDVTSDYVFKGIFRDEARVKDFLENILVSDEANARVLPKDTKIEELIYIPTDEAQHMPEVGGKKILFDLQIRTNRGIFIVEMQKRPTSQEEYSKRLEFYTSMAYSHQQIKGQAKKGLEELGIPQDRISKMRDISMKDYTFALPVISVSVISERFRIFPPKVPCISYHVNIERKTGESYMRSLSYVFIELQKFNEEEDNPEISKGAREWLLFMKTQDMQHQYANDQVNKAVEYVQRVQRDEYQEYVKHEITEIAVMKEQEAAVKAKALEIAKSLLTQGIHNDVISTATGLSLDEISKLKPDQAM